MAAYLSSQKIWIVAGHLPSGRGKGDRIRRCLPLCSCASGRERRGEAYGVPIDETRREALGYGAVVHGLNPRTPPAQPPYAIGEAASSSLPSLGAGQGKEEHDCRTRATDLTPLSPSMSLERPASLLWSAPNSPYKPACPPLLSRPRRRHVCSSATMAEARLSLALRIHTRTLASLLHLTHPGTFPHPRR